MTAPKPFKLPKETPITDHTMQKFFREVGKFQSKKRLSDTQIVALCSQLISTIHFSCGAPKDHDMVLAKYMLDNISHIRRGIEAGKIKLAK